MALYAWAFDDSCRRRRYICILVPLVFLAMSEWELSFTQLYLYPAALLLPMLCFVGKNRTVAWEEVLTAAIIGGLVCWKIADKWPLFWGTRPLCAILLLIPTLILCRERGDRFLACAFGSLIFELFACLREYMLFSFCVLRLGSREALSLGASSICLYAAFEQIVLAVRPRRKPAVPIGN